MNHTTHHDPIESFERVKTLAGCSVGHQTFQAFTGSRGTWKEQPKP